MALVVKDRVQETTTTTGTGTVTLAGAVSGFQSFSAIGNGNTTYYAIVGATEWELGIGTYTSSGTTLSRDTVLSSSNSGSLVNFSAGAKNVFCTYSAVKSVGYDIASTSTGSLSLPVGTTAERPTGAAGMIRYNTTTNNPEWYAASASQWLNFSQPPNYNVEFLVIAGGGGGSLSNFATGGGAGGAGGYRSSVIGEMSGGGASAENQLNLTSGITYTVTVGAGGPDRTNGNNSVFDTVTSVGGGRGGGFNQVAAGNGGSGGGNAYQTGGAGSGTAGQGYAGGGTGDIGGGSGGGGAGGVGAGGSSSRIGGNGGAGVTSSITGTAVDRAGGGGGGATSNYASPAVGGTATAGGGNGGANTSGSPGSANTGGGGGGPVGNGSSTGGQGGSGIVIIRYLGLQKGTGGTVTSSGGYTIHTFTTSGSYIA
jgi:hypothetical protein